MPIRISESYVTKVKGYHKKFTEAIAAFVIELKL